VTQSRFHTEDLQTLVATLQNVAEVGLCISGVGCKGAEFCFSFYRYVQMVL
jgi:hypothetical protein